MQENHKFKASRRYMAQDYFSKTAKQWNKAVTYPRIGDPCLGVFKSWQEPHGQVMGHVQQFIIIILNCHVTKGLSGVSYYSVSRKEASQNPDTGRKK